MKRRNAVKLFVALLALVTVTSCFKDKDDSDNLPLVPSIGEVLGDFKGEVTKGEVSEAFECKVESDKIIFSAFPIDSIITSIVGEELAPEILDSIGSVVYNIGYTAALDEKNRDSVLLTLTTEPLQFSFNLPATPEVNPLIFTGEEAQPAKVEVVAEISVAKEGGYSIYNENLSFGLDITKITVNEQELPEFEAITLSFEANKKK